ncbi:hypothetical protein, partial [Nostoc sp.]|uniref:hypothetical protein n=1 Tax=Nostoc sp. TaxID=1180 RepID=UPI002FFA0815
LQNHFLHYHTIVTPTFTYTANSCFRGESEKLLIKVDGQLVEESQKLFDTGSEHRFDVNGNSCILRIRPGALGGLTGFEFELFVDGCLV